jgi:hypothetical protein
MMSDTFLKKEFDSLGYEINEVIPGILLIKDFISQNEISDYFKIINSTEEETWFIHYRNNLKDFCMLKFGRDDVENLVAEGKFEITHNWEDKVLKVVDTEIDMIVSSRFKEILKMADNSLELSGFGTIQRMQEGVQLTPHTDQHTDPSIKYAAVLYLNDEYSDGEIFFENKGIQLKPSPGTLLVFPGNEDFKHGVKHVGNGPIRYVLPGFIKVKNFYKNNKY